MKNKLMIIILFGLIVIPLTTGIQFRKTIWFSQDSFDRMVRDMDTSFSVETGFCMKEFTSNSNVLIDYVSKPSKYYNRTFSSTEYDCAAYNYARGHTHPMDVCTRSETDRKMMNKSGYRYGMIVCSTNITKNTFYDRDDVIYYYDNYAGGYHKFKTIDSK